MAHIHEVYDTNVHFVIDPITRTLSKEGDAKMKIVQHDHNSERVTFEIPRYIDGHDMATCNVVHVHYLNVSADGRTTAPGVYEIDDMHVSAEDENLVIGTWLISRNATQLVGSLNFLIRFMCVTDGAEQYAWNTGVCADMVVATGLYNGEVIVDDYADVLLEWLEKFNSTPLCVTLNTGTMTANKTFAEILAAVKAKRVVIVRMGTQLWIDRGWDPGNIGFKRIYTQGTEDNRGLNVSRDRDGVESWNYADGAFPLAVLPMDDIAAEIVSRFTNVAEEGA